MSVFEPYRKIVLWGATQSLDSTRHIYRAYHDTLAKLGIPVVWVADAPASREAIGAGDLVFAMDIWGAHIGPAIADVDYVLHNFTPDHELSQTIDERRLLRLQVYTDDALQWEHETWDACRLFHRGGRTLFQPWGTDLLAEEFYDPVFNLGAEECCFVGAIWDDNGLGNAQMIPELTAALERRRLTFTHLTQVSDEANIAAVRRSRIAPAIAGGWQVSKNYMPCRVFKNVSYGQLAVTNVPRFHDLFGDSFVWGDTLDEIVGAAIDLTGRSYVERVREQQAVVARYTYRESLSSIARALEEGR